MSAFLEYGYRGFEGRRRGRLWRWTVVTRAALTQTWKSRLLRGMTFLSWAPLLYFGLYFFAIGQLTQLASDPQDANPVLFTAVMWLGSDLIQQLGQDPASVRVGLWTVAFYFLSSYTQLLAVLLVPALVGPGLVADDRRRGALHLYFSRPITVFDYVFGKLVAVMTFVAAVSLFPMVGLYAVSILTAPSVDVFYETWDVLVRIVLASVALVVPTSCLILLLSSLTSRRRYLAFLWIGFVVGSFIVRMVVLVPQLEARAFRDRDWVDYSTYCAYGTNLANVASGILDAEERVGALPRSRRSPLNDVSRVLGRLPDWRWSLAILGALSVLSLGVTVSMVRARDRGWT